MLSTRITGLAVYLIIGLTLNGYRLSARFPDLLPEYYCSATTTSRLDRTGDELRTSRGFFQTNTVSARLSRVQAVRFKQSVLRQWLHLSTVQALISLKCCR
jgi:putative membrane protein